MNTDRMRTLERLARQIPPALLDMTQWFGNCEDCGTVACLAGHATRCPEFHHQGLRVDEGYQPCYYDPVRDPEADEMSYGFSALEEFFDLTAHQTKYLFDARSYSGNPTPAEVADRVKELIETRDEEY